MFHHGTSLQDNLVPGLSASQTKVHVIVVHWKGLIEPAEFIKDCTAHHEARSGDRRLLACDLEPWPNCTSPRRPSGVTGSIGCADVNARVLDPSVGIREQRPNGTDISSCRLSGHSSHPIRIQW